MQSLIWRTIGRRLLGTIPVMAVVAIVAFLLIYISPGDPAAIIAGDTATADDIARIRSGMGLDRPLPQQFVIWLWNVLHGDLGKSVVSGQPVAGLIRQRLEPTLSLAFTTIVFSVAVALPLGTLAASKAGSWADRGLTMFSILFFSLPVFLTGYVLIDVLALNLRLFPIQGYKPLSAGIGPWLGHLALPTICVSIVFVALISRMTRSSVIESLGSDYIRTARAKGVPERRILGVHALRNAAIPIATTIGLGVAGLLNGVVVVENVFALPGLGRLTVDAVLQRDFPVIRGVILVLSLVYVLVNLVVDLSYIVLDPRLRK